MQVRSGTNSFGDNYKKLPRYTRETIREAFRSFTRHSYRDPRTGRYAKKPDRIIKIICSWETMMELDKVFKEELDKMKI